jgi:hypothetical protein
MTGPTYKRTLDRIIWRSRLKALLRIGGILLMLVGAMFLPVAHSEPGPKTTIFNRIVRLGTLAEPGMMIMGVGAIAFAASWLVRRADLD